MNSKDFENFHTKTIMPRTASSVSEAQKLIEQLVGKPITNTKLSITATISKKAVGKFGSSEATKKSISPRLHAKAVANIDVLFQNAEFDVTHKDLKGMYEVEQIHRLGALMFDEVTNEHVPIMITVKEISNPKGNRIYSIEAVDLAKKANPTEAVGLESAGQLTVGKQSSLQQVPIAEYEAAIANFTANIQQLFEKVKQR